MVFGSTKVGSAALILGVTVGVTEGVGAGVGAGGVKDGSENHVLRAGVDDGGVCFDCDTGVAPTSFGVGAGGGAGGTTFSFAGGLPFDFSSNSQLALREFGLTDAQDESVVPNVPKSKEASFVAAAESSGSELFEGVDSVELFALAPTLALGVWGRGADFSSFALGSKPWRNGSTSPPTIGEICAPFFLGALAKLAGLGATAGFAGHEKDWDWVALASAMEGWIVCLGGDLIAGRGVGGIGIGIGMPEREDVTIGDVSDGGGELIMGRERDGMGPAIEE
jgi:hypothetical protein